MGGFCKRKLATYCVIAALVLVPVAGWTGDQVPFKANLVLQATIAQVNTCSSGTVLLQISGGGYATHLGATTDQQSHCQNFATGTFSNGQYTFTAANGDTIFGTYSGQLVPAGNAFVIDGQFTITGGTGRFVGATGDGSASGTQSVAGEANLVLLGAISSVRSD